MAAEPQRLRGAAEQTAGVRIESHRVDQRAASAWTAPETEGVACRASGRECSASLDRCLWAWRMSRAGVAKSWAASSG